MAALEKLGERLAMERVRVGLIGAGSMANRVHYPALAGFPDVEIAALENWRFIDRIKEGRQPSRSLADAAKTMRFVARTHARALSAREVLAGPKSCDRSTNA